MLWQSRMTITVDPGRNNDCNEVSHVTKIMVMMNVSILLVSRMCKSFIPYYIPHFFPPPVD